MSYTTPTEKTCLRCGNRWRTRWKYLAKGEKDEPPKRCARCRSPLWNTPKTVNSGPKSQLEIQRDGLGKKSAELQALLTGAGFVKGGGVSSDGLALVKRLAQEQGIRDWPDTRHAEDYERLIAAVRTHLTSQSSMREKSKGRVKVMPSLRAVVKDWKQGQRKARR